MAKRAVMLGLDDLIPDMVGKFVEEGAMPRIAQMMERDCFSRVGPVPPSGLNDLSAC